MLNRSALLSQLLKDYSTVPYSTTQCSLMNIESSLSPMRAKEIRDYEYMKFYLMKRGHITPFVMGGRRDLMLIKTPGITNTRMAQLGLTVL